MRRHSPVSYIGPSLRRWSAITAIALCLLLCLYAISHAAQDTDLLIVTENLPPYNYREGTEIKGVAAEVAQALLNELGLQADIHVVSWVRAYLKALKHPNVLIFSIVRTPDRDEHFHWIGKVATAQSFLFKLADRQDIELMSIDDARPYRIGTWREDVREQYFVSHGFVKGKQLDSSGSPKQNVQKLMRRRLDLVADSDLSFYYLLKTLNYNPKLFVKAFKLEAISLPFYIALSKKTSPKLVVDFKRAMESVKKKGILQAIQKKYLGMADEIQDFR